VRPKITSLSPTRGLIGRAIDVTINGRGFGTNPTVNVAGTGITVTITSKTNTQINTSFAIASNAGAGNHGVTVTSRGQTSNTVNFFVQVPSRLARTSISNVIVIDPGPGNIVNAFGQVVATNVCGAYRNRVYTLVDQQGQPIVADVPVTESFYDYQGPGSTPQPLTQSTTDGRIGDVLAIFKTYPSCPSNGEGISFRQKFSVTVAGTTFQLSTINFIQMQKSSGTYTINVTVERQ